MNSIRCHPPCSGVENKTWIGLGLGRPRQDKQDASRFGSRRCLRPHEPKTRRVNRVIPSSRATTSLERRVKKLPGNTPDPAYSQRVLDYSQELRGTQAHTVPSSSLRRSILPESTSGNSESRWAQWGVEGLGLFLAPTTSKATVFTDLKIRTVPVERMVWGR